MSSPPDFRLPKYPVWIIAANHDLVNGRWEFWIAYKQERKFLTCTDIMPDRDIFEACLQTRNELIRQEQIAQAVKKRLLS